MTPISSKPETSSNGKWPIYSLANYEEDSGSLLDLCQFNFITTSTQACGGSKKKTSSPSGSLNALTGDQQTTSGYLTGEESCNTCNGGPKKRESREAKKRRGKRGKTKKRRRLLWWQLIERSSSRDQQLLNPSSQASLVQVRRQEQELRRQLLQLCFNLHKAVR